MLDLLRHPLTALRIYKAREEYLVKCRSIGYSDGAARLALLLHRHADDPYAAAWAWLAEATG